MDHRLGRKLTIDAEPLETSQAPRTSLVAQEGQGQIQIDTFCRMVKPNQTRTKCVWDTRDIADPASKEESSNSH